MKSVFIGFIALSATVMMFAQIPAINQPKRVLQTLAPVFQANVTTLANVINKQVGLTHAAAVILSISTKYAADNGVPAQQIKMYASILCNDTLALQAVVATNTSALYTAQLALVAAQAQASVALAQAQIYDNLVAQGVLALVSTNALTNTASTTATAAATLALANLQGQVTFQVAFANALSANYTLAAGTAQTNLNLVANQGNAVSLAQNNIAINALATFNANANLKGVSVATVLSNIVAINVATTGALAVYVGGPTVAANLAAVQTQTQTAVNALALLGVAADAAFTTANTAVLAAQAAVNTAYYFYSIAQSSIVAQEYLSVNVANNSIYFQIFSSNLNNGVAVNAAALVANTLLLNTQVQASVSLANSVNQQNLYRIMMTNMRITQIQNNAATLGNQQSAATNKFLKAQIMVRVALNKQNLSLAQAQLAFYNAN